MAAQRFYRIKDPGRGLIIAQGVTSLQRANHIGVAYMRDTGHKAVLERMTTYESVLHRRVIPRAG
jgi:hypothetical protein